MTLVQRFTAGEPLEGVKILQVGKLPDVQGAVPPPAEDVTTGLYSPIMGGVLQLTRAEVWTGATVFFDLPGPWPPALAPALEASFRVYIHGGSGGDGISFSYGDMEDQYIDEMARATVCAFSCALPACSKGPRAERDGDPPHCAAEGEAAWRGGSSRSDSRCAALCPPR